MKKTEKTTVIKAGLWYIIVNFISKGAVFLTTPIFTRLMTAGDIGAYANVTSWFQVLVALVTFDFYVSLGVARFDYKNELNKYISSTLVYGSVITSIVYVVVAFNLDFFCDFFSINAYAIHIIFIYMLVYPALQMLQQKNLFLYKYKLSAAITLVSLFLSVGLSLILTLSMQDKLWGRTIGYYSPLIIVNLVIYIYFMIQGKNVSLKYLKYAVTIAFPMIWHSMATQVLSAGDRIIITRFNGEQANALYSVAYTCSMVVTVLWSSMNSAWSPWSIEKMNSGDTEEMKKATYPYIVIFSIIVIMIMLVSPELLWVMGGEHYVQAKYCLPPIMVGLVCQFIYSLYINAEFYLKKQTRIAVGTILAATINIGLNLIFVPKYGYVSAAYTTLAGYVVLLLFHYISLMLLGKKHWYDNRFNWMVVLGFLVMIPAMIFVYEYTLLRYALFSAFGMGILVFVYIKRDIIIKLLKSFMNKS
jgi:O-antigen/teichoic acid export membrane protein